MSAWFVSQRHIDLLVGAALPNRHHYDQGLRWEVARTADQDLGGPTIVQVTRECTAETATEVGRMLWEECRRSIAYHYPHHEATDGNDNLQAVLGYRYQVVPSVIQPSESPNGRRVVVSPVVVLKAIDCYEYQSCEHPEWATSEAQIFCHALRRRVCSELGGYDDGPWGL